MGRVCCMVNCNSGGLKDRKSRSIRNIKQASLFLTPKDPERLAQWASALNMNLYKNQYICELHFKMEDIIKAERVSSFTDTEMYGKEKWKLRRNAIPFNSELNNYDYKENHITEMCDADNSKVEENIGSKATNKYKIEELRGLSQDPLFAMHHVNVETEIDTDENILETPTEEINEDENWETNLVANNTDPLEIDEDIADTAIIKFEKETLSTKSEIDIDKGMENDESKSFTSKGKLKSRKLKHTVQELYSCDDCGKSYYQKTSLSLHRRSHDTTRYICDICGKSYQKLFNFSQHKSTHKSHLKIKGVNWLVLVTKKNTVEVNKKKC